LQEVGHPDDALDFHNGEAAVSAINARTHVLEMIRQAAERAAEKGVEVKVEYSEFTIDGKIEATVTATPSGDSQP